MNKDQLQKELKEKIKAGIKPSHLTKRGKKQDKKDVLPSPIVYDKGRDKDQGYESDKSDKSIPTPPPPPNQNRALLKQIELHKEIKKADEKKKQELEEKIKTLIKLAGEEKEQWKKTIEKSNTLITDKEQMIKKLQTKIQEQGKTIEELKKQGKNKGEVKETDKLFTCSHCLQEWSTEFLKLVDPQGKKTCAECLENMLQLTKQETGKEIIIEEATKPQEEIKPCQFCRTPFKASQLKPRHITNLPNHDPREIILICQECLIYRAKKADYYCPLTSEGRDLYEGNEFDCYCPTNP